MMLQRKRRRSGVALLMSIVTIAILALRSTSGAHINPAVSTGFVLTGHLPRQRWLGYVLAQGAGGLLGSGMVHFLVGPDELAPTVVAFSTGLLRFTNR